MMFLLPFVVYATCSGFSINLVSIIGRVVYKQALDMSASVGLGLVAAGAITINVFSKLVTR